MENNKLYKGAWRVLWIAHTVIFAPMAVLWMFTYMGSSTIVNFYNEAMWYIGTVAAASIFTLISLLFMLSGIAYEESSLVSQGYIFLETFLYIFMELFAWYTTVWEYPKAHDQFYYANRIILEEESTKKKPEIIQPEDFLDDPKRPPIPTADDDLLPRMNPRIIILPDDLTEDIDDESISNEDQIFEV